MKNLKYFCISCDYTYDPIIGDHKGGILPQTEFADLSDDWVCPICGQSKKSFRYLKNEREYSYKSFAEADIDDLLMK